MLRVIEAILDTSQDLRRELMLYQLIFETFCEREGLNDAMRQQIIDRARELSAARIGAATQAAQQELLAKAEEIVALLDSDRDEALRLLNGWKPTGPPN